jgi:Transposase IS66 family
MANCTGFLQADGYSGFDKLYDPARTKPRPITEVTCWTHNRIRPAAESQGNANLRPPRNKDTDTHRSLTSALGRFEGLETKKPLDLRQASRFH